jgi:hypothetical protein
MLRTTMRLSVHLSLGTLVLFKALSLQKQLPLAHLVKRAMHTHWTDALAAPDVGCRKNVGVAMVVLRLRPALAERVRLAFQRNRSAMVERCCLLYLQAIRDASPGEAHQSAEYE